MNDGALAQVASAVAELTQARFPGGEIPYHSRWRHFEAGQVDRVALLDQRLGPVDAAARARAHIDLVLVSVLLDAGAGPDWVYREADTGLSLARSEGLGVASLHAFTAGLFSSDPSRPCQVDANGLMALTPAHLAQAFQVAPGNPLVGLAGRTQLLRSLGRAMLAQPAIFGPSARPGGLYDALLATAGAAHGFGAHRFCARHSGALAGHPVGHLAVEERH
ncbi:MAG: DUF1688 family protein [Burkholderiaceae bacterium]